MKKIVLLAIVLLATAGCGKTDKPQGAEGDTLAQTQTDGPQPSSSDLTLTDTVKAGGQTLIVTLTRETDKTLPTVTDEMGTTFYDNKVNVSVTRGGEQVFTHSFTKADFEASLPERDKKTGVLLGMAVDKAKSTAQLVVLGAQVGEPGLEDEASTFAISVTPGSEGFTTERVQNQITTRDDMLEEGD